jgi:hypothetical protein
VDCDTRLWRVQVKSTYQPRGSGYSLTVQHLTGQGSPHYTEDEIDILVAYVVPANAWYVLPLAAFLPRRQLRLYPHGCKWGGKFEKYREAWQLISG